MTTAIYFHPLNELHEMGGNHPESPARFRAMMQAFRDSGIDDIVQYRISPEATEADIRRVHTQDMINRAKEEIPAKGEYIYLGETPMNHWSYKATLRTSGAAIAAVDAMLDGEITNAFSIARPIGHHSEIGEAMGFCMFNSLAVAAMYALKVRKLERICIVDLDVHHGNGTESAFAYEKSALMVSYYQKYIYPFSGNERKREHMVNVGVEEGTDGTKIREIVETQWLPAIEKHKPQMFFISSGFDAHKDDPIGGMGLTADDYYWVTQKIVECANRHCGGHIISSSEGGYNIEALKACVTAHVKALAGK